MPTSRRRLLAGLSALALTPLVAACGADTAEQPGTRSGSTGGASGAAGTEQGAFPASIEHRYGTTEVTAAPQRVVCVGLVEQDMLLALGVAPVAVTYWFGEADGQVFPWATDALGDAPVPEVLRPSSGVEVEAIAALAPDLIIAMYSALTQQEYDLLSKLAPVVAQSGDYADFGMPWDETTLKVGTAVGRPAAAQTLVTDVNGQIDRAAADNPQFQGRSAVVVAPFEGLFIYGPDDPRARMLTQLGFEFPLARFGDQMDEFGVSLSAERTTDLDTIDTVVWLDLAADAAVQGLYEGTTSFAEGRFIDISEADGDFYVAHSMVTPLSIPYLLERYVPQLIAAADGDPATVPPEPGA